MKKILPLILTIFFLSVWSSADAKCRRTATVKYEKQDGWSKKYTIEVSFMTGYELNQATSSCDYSMFSNYAVIFGGEGQATVIKLTSNLVSGREELTCDCIHNTIYDLQGYDQDGDKWNICLSGCCYL